MGCSDAYNRKEDKMSCRDEIIECAKDVMRKSGQSKFSIQEIIDCMFNKKTDYKKSTIRTHITSRMCIDAPQNHAVTYPDLERIGHGEYRLCMVTEKQNPTIASKQQSNKQKIKSTGMLVIGIIDFNDLKTVRKFKVAVQNILKKSSAYFQLSFKPGFYFEIIGNQLPNCTGWYIILNGANPMYVGKAADLNVRLNTNHGSLDNFAAKSRKGDPERNFIKKFIEIVIVKNIRVCVITKKELCDELGICNKTFSELDKANTEKVLNLFSSEFSYRRDNAQQRH